MHVLLPLLAFASLVGPSTALARPWDGPTTGVPESPAHGNNVDEIVRARVHGIHAKIVAEGRRLARFGQRRTDDIAFPRHATDGRRLEDECVPSEIFADDEDLLTTFGPDFQPSCTCRTDEPALNALFDNENLTMIDLLTDDVNDLLRNASFDEGKECRNGCASCLGTICAVHSGGESTRARWDLVREVTALDLLLLGNATDDQVDDFIRGLFRTTSATYSSYNCYRFVTGDEIGEVCFGNANALSFDDDDQPLPFGPRDINVTVTVDGTDCNACTLADDGSCLTCDCTNVVPGATPSNCGADPGSTFIGIFAPFYVFAVDPTTVVGNYTVGPCFSPTSPPSSGGPTHAPTGGPSLRVTGDPTEVPADDPAGNPSAVQDFSFSVLCGVMIGLFVTILVL